MVATVGWTVACSSHGDLCSGVACVRGGSWLRACVPEGFFSGIVARHMAEAAVSRERGTSRNQLACSTRLRRLSGGREIDSRRRLLCASPGWPCDSLLFCCSSDRPRLLLAVLQCPPTQTIRLTPIQTPLLILDLPLTRTIHQTALRATTTTTTTPRRKSLQSGARSTMRAFTAGAAT